MDGTIERGQAAYPALLLQLPDAPRRLYYRGQWDETLFADCLAVVGTRKMTSYGKHVTEALVGPLAASGVTIVSGFMYGIDATAHRAALDAGGRTIAVMPCGIERVHPARQGTLYREILRRGLVLSECPGPAVPATWTFPRRNRIIAGLAPATLVVEGTEESGALITAAVARRHGRRVFAVPGPLTAPTSQGPIRLLRDGATVVSRAEDILACYGRPARVAGSDGAARPGVAPPAPRAHSTEGRIVAQLRKAPADIDELARALRRAPAVIGATLSVMQLRGQVVEEGGRYALGLR